MHSKKAYFQLILLQKLPKNLKANLEEAKVFSKRREKMDIWKLVQMKILPHNLE
jgi:hypothetical protein